MKSAVANTIVNPWHSKTDTFLNLPFSGAALKTQYGYTLLTNIRHIFKKVKNTKLAFNVPLTVCCQQPIAVQVILVFPGYVSFGLMCILNSSLAPVVIFNGKILAENTRVKVAQWCWSRQCGQWS